jgi:hypothetical protein
MSLRSSVSMPKALNVLSWRQAICQRTSTARWVVRAVKSTVARRRRPHMGLGPGAPDPPAAPSRSMPESRHSLDDFGSVRSKAVLGGLPHEYSLASA